MKFNLRNLLIVNFAVWFFAVAVVMAVLGGCNG